ncbi:MAG TPA: serine protease [Phycisphaerae bacterium]|nr:serine protease [Phycisphaerae bacterium]
MGPINKSRFWAAAVWGEAVELEYQAPPGCEDEPIIEINEISHLYANPPASILRQGKPSKQDGVIRMTVLPCQEDVNCHSVDPVARDSVGCMQFTDNGSTYWCAGALLADADPNTFAGYFLTANHCLSTQQAVDSLTVYWLYQTESCNGPFPPLEQQPKSLGGTLLAASPASDFTFIRLADDPNDGQGFAAWTTADASGTLTGIHHPGQGTFKRVAFGALTGEPPVCAGYSTSNYWYLDWTTGVTEGGSSGSPLFNTSWQVVGQLFGACLVPGKTVGCDNPEDYNILYGKFGATYPSIAGWLTQVIPDDAYEDNDSLEQAAPISRGSHNLKLLDFEDIFLINSPQSGQITVTATYNPADFQPLLQLVHPNGTSIAQSGTWSGTETVTSSQPPGSYKIRMLKQRKWGGNYTLNITLPPAYSDFDMDGDVDMVDFGHLQRCYSGSGPQADPACFDACLDGDNRVNAADLAVFNACYSGPNVPAGAGCKP